MNELYLRLYLRLFWVGVHIIAMGCFFWRLYRDKNELQDMQSHLEDSVDKDGWHTAIELQEDNIDSTYTWIFFVFVFMTMDMYALVGEPSY